MWSVDSQDWRITAGGQTEAGLIANVTQWVNSLPTATRGGSSLMHDLSNITLGADLKALPLLHAKVHLSPIGVCAGWVNASYLEQQTNASHGVIPGGTHTYSEAVTLKPLYTLVFFCFLLVL